MMLFNTPTIQRCIRRHTTDASRAGAVAVEFAVVAPLILLFFMAAIEITQLNFLRHTAANAAYEGARTAIVLGGSAAEARTAANAYLSNLKIASGSTVTVNQTADAVEVTVSLPASKNSWGLNTFTAGKTVVQTCILKREAQE
jgi:Flp pilus assembly protein TadG